jgi:hypothetical protein
MRHDVLKYPITLYVKPYSGNKADLKHQFYEKLQSAKQVEKYINDQLQQSEDGIYVFDIEILEYVYLSESELREIYFHNDCGSNGITIKKKTINN